MKSFYRQQKTHAAAAAATTKPTGGVSKKAAVHHHKKAVLATNVHPAPGIDPGPNPPPSLFASAAVPADRPIDSILIRLS